MVLIPASATAQKKRCPNSYNAGDNSITVNGEVFRDGDELAFACIRKPGTPWGTMMRSAKITNITAAEGEQAQVTLEGLSDWEAKTVTCGLDQIV